MLGRFAPQHLPSDSILKNSRIYVILFCEIINGIPSGKSSSNYRGRNTCSNENRSSEGHFGADADVLRFTRVISRNKRVKMGRYAIGISLNALQIKRYKLSKLTLAVLGEVDDLILVTNTQAYAVCLKRFIEEGMRRFAYVS